MKRRSLDVIRVFRAPVDPCRGRIRAGAVEWPCALGRAGPVSLKREGDGGTPTGRMAVLAGFYRSDRMPRPPTLLALRALRPHDGWCDDPASRLYNRLIRLPAKAVSHERLWREDELYDIVVDLGWNRRTVRRGGGSAIFLHLARPGFGPTEGCVAVSRGTLLRLLVRMGRATRVEVGHLARPRPSLG